jgi:hypothetical protein
VIFQNQFQIFSPYDPGRLSIKSVLILHADRVRSRNDVLIEPRSFFAEHLTCPAVNKKLDAKVYGSYSNQL